MKEGNQLSDPSRRTKTLYFICWIANVMVNFDHGIVPAASKEIKQDLLLTDVKLGILGSLVYVGLLVGSVAASHAFTNNNTRKLISFVVAAYSASLLLFLASDSLVLLALSRALVGFFQVFLVIFFPVWVDLHGGTKQTMWLTFLQLGVPLGVFLGYISTSLFVKYLNNVSLIIFFIFSSEDIDIQMKENTEIPKEQPKMQHLDSHHSGKNNNNNSNSNRLSSSNSHCALHRLSIEPTLVVNRNHTYSQNLSRLFSNKLYLYTMLTLASLYFVVTGIQFWISDYMRTILHIDQKTVFTGFSIVSLTAPVLGVIVGGIVLDKIGGYSSKNALSLCLINGFLASACAIPIPFLNSFQQVITLLWLLLFFGGSLMPAVTGIMLQSVPKNLSAFAFSSASLFHNLLGYLPAPFLYGYINQLGANPQSRKGMIFLMGWSIWGIVGLVLAWREQTILFEKQEDEERAKQAQQQDISIYEEHSDKMRKDFIKNQYLIQEWKKVFLKLIGIFVCLLVSKITEKESEQSQSVYGKGDLDEVLAAKKLELQKVQVESQASQSVQQDEEESVDSPIRPYAYNEIRKGALQPLLNKSHKSGSVGSLFNPKLFAQDSEYGRRSAAPNKHGNNNNNNTLDFSKIRPKFYKFNESPKASGRMERQSSLSFLAGMFGKSNSILFIDDEEEQNFKQSLHEHLSGINHNNQGYFEMDELQK